MEDHLDPNNTIHLYNTYKIFIVIKNNVTKNLTFPTKSYLATTFSIGLTAGFKRGVVSR